MHKIIQYWNQNRKKILIVIGVIAFIIIIIQMLNYFAKVNQENKKPSNTISNTLVTDVTKPNESVISNTTISNEKAEENSKIVKEFITLCNQKQYENAYNLLTDDCKRYVYKSVNDFVSNYVNSIFKTEKTFGMELWYAYDKSYTYRVNFYNGNPLASGQLSSGSNMQDYITIIVKNGERKLNINQFIGKKEINKQAEKQNVKINIENKLIYVNNEIYEMTINNQTNQTIMLSDGQSSKSICLVDGNESEYISYVNELPTSSFIMNAGYQKKLTIKFNKVYNPELPIKQLVFKEIYTDYEQYKQNKGQAQKVAININL